MHYIAEETELLNLPTPLPAQQRTLPAKRGEEKGRNRKVK